ncbi:MAG: hypothetical protein J1E38_02035 [Paramuribaculum sp.]|nr:hypothetical protein [Paramuribaculum sp.]
MKYKIIVLVLIVFQLIVGCSDGSNSSRVSSDDGSQISEDTLAASDPYTDGMLIDSVAAENPDSTLIFLNINDFLSKSGSSFRLKKMETIKNNFLKQGWRVEKKTYTGSEADDWEGNSPRTMTDYYLFAGRVSVELLSLPKVLINFTDKAEIKEFMTTAKNAGFIGQGDYLEAPSGYPKVFVSGRTVVIEFSD